MKLVAWAGSSVINRESLQRGLRSLKKMKSGVVVPASLVKNATRPRNKNLPFLASDDATKIRELLKIVRNPRNDGLLATRGGYGCIRLLPLLDKLALPKRRTFLTWGYSDLTALQLYFFSRMGWTYVQGPLIGSDSIAQPDAEEKKSYANFFAAGIFPADFPLRLVAGTPDKKMSTPKLFLGGNLATLVSLIGTPWEAQPRKDFLLFLEDIAEPTYKLDRLLQQLGHSQFFASCRGVVLGHFTDCVGYRGCFTEFAKQFGRPVFEELPLGHAVPRLPLLMGVPVRLERRAEKGTGHPTKGTRYLSGNFLLSYG